MTSTQIQRSSPEFDWKTAPLDVAKKRLADLKRIYDHALQVVSLRQIAQAVIWHCWSQSHKKDGLVPDSVLAQCHDLIPDGRWVFRDDGALTKDGSRCSIVCCSQLCYKVYVEWQVRDKLERKSAQAQREQESIR